MKLRRTGALAIALVPLAAATAMSRGGPDVLDAVMPSPEAAETVAGSAAAVAAPGSVAAPGVATSTAVGGEASSPAPDMAPPAPRTSRDPALRPLRSSGAVAWSPERAPFRLRVGGEPVLHRVMGMLAMPGESVAIELPGGAASHAFTYQDGSAVESGAGWRWTAPRRPGVYAARIEAADGGAVHLNLLVAHPATEMRDGAIEGYPIGSYVKKPLRGLAAYRPPTGFVRVAETDRDVLVSPHFTLGQFLCKQPGEPRFVSYSSPLVLKLEEVLEAANERGIDAPTFHVMSGFRTPAYNRAIGNNTVYSRHLWGDAADIFVDADGNGDMDDLTGDGRSDLADARLLSRIVEDVESAGVAGVRAGGMGIYRRNSAHGPFVHVDARGYRARW